ncbi:ADP-ribosyltransferase [Bacteroides uniformis]|uniref:ADP-ribosyltransferase n=1 Tax=Bacteroides uniformis TaxID=820 RepID=UPI00233F59B0|nr:ADP-ribosyltransferase [Bacteroides uniformis]MDC1809055.1 ADP-ribosyltransferase [Bacteroides uniformis]
MIEKIEKSISGIKEAIAKRIYKRVLAKESALIQGEGKYIVFRSVESIDKWSEEDGNIVASPIERETNYWSNECYDSKDLYEMLEMYCGYKNESINHFLRMNKPLHSWNGEFEIEDTLKYISKIDSEMQKRKLHCNLLTVRWVHLDNIQKCLGCQLSEIKPGQECIDRGYMSTSLYLHYTGEYDIAPKKMRHEILLLLKLPIGNNGIYIRKEISNRNEYEYLINRGTSFVIEKVYYRFFRPFIIVCQVQNRNSL